MQWRSDKQFPTLNNNQIHIWRAGLKQPATQIPELIKLLNPAEQTRANQFKVMPARNNFIVARSALRQLLGQYLQRHPAEIVFGQNSYGKLLLPQDNLQFNLSHSHDYALFIFAKNYHVGIDIEQIRDNFDYLAIAQKFFAPQEITDLLNLPQEQQLSAFFNCWSRKEAFIKGIGKGIFCALDKFAVEVCTQTAGRLKLSIDATQLLDLEQTSWSLEALWPAAGYAGAFAVAGSDYQTGCYDYHHNQIPE